MSIHGDELYIGSRHGLVVFDCRSGSARMIDVVAGGAVQALTQGFGNYGTALAVFDNELVLLGRQGRVILRLQGGPDWPKRISSAAVWTIFWSWPAKAVCGFTKISTMPFSHGSRISGGTSETLRCGSCPAASWTLAEILRRILLWCLGLLVLLGAIVWLGKPEIGSKNLPLVTGSLDLAWADGQVETIIDDEGYSSWVALDDVPVGLALAVVGVEDFRYFRHPGLDINQIYYAIIENIRNLGFTYGASTITQQLVKNVWLANTRSFTRKLAEAIMALELEGKLSKQEILEWYLNMCEMAPGIYGIRAGSRFYFGLEPHELRYGQQVFLVAVIHAPAWYAGHPERAIPRIRQLAVNLVEQKRITPSQASALSNVPFEFAKMRPKPNDTGLRKALLRLWPASSRTGKNLVLQSRLDGAVQAELEQLMHDLRADGGDVFVVDGGGRSLVLATGMVPNECGPLIRN